MANYLSQVTFQQALLVRLKVIVGNGVPVGHLFFRDFGKYPNGFVTYEIDEFHQQTFLQDYSQQNVGLAKASVNIKTASTSIDASAALFEQIRADLNAYSGWLDRSAASPTVHVGWCELGLVNEEYDDEQKVYVYTAEASFELNSI